jgi:hypothetical protein
MLLKGMQAAAGLLAWDKKYHTTAVKGYKEGINIAATHPPFKALTSDSVALNSGSILICRNLNKHRNVV